MKGHTHVHPRIRPPHALRVAVLALDGKVPVRVQRDARRKGHERHVEVRHHHDAEQHLARPPRPLEREEVDVQEQDGDLGEGQREQVEEDAVPRGLFSYQSVTS